MRPSCHERQLPGQSDWVTARWNNCEVQGLRSYESSTWHGLAAPAGTPQAILQRLNAEVVRILKTDDIRNRFASLGSTAAPGTPAEFSAAIKTDFDKWAKVVKAAGVTLE
jgi:tripartite-type tricarboxylate transporter receptor subunit TctC